MTQETTFNREQALQKYTKLMEQYHAANEEQGIPILNAIEVMDEQARRECLEFAWNGLDQQWCLQTLTQEDLDYLDAHSDEDEEEADGDGSGLHQCAYCYNLVQDEHEEFCSLNPNRNMALEKEESE